MWQRWTVRARDLNIPLCAAPLLNPNAHAPALPVPEQRPLCICVWYTQHYCGPETWANVIILSMRSKGLIWGYRICLSAQWSYRVNCWHADRVWNNSLRIAAISRAINRLTEQPYPIEPFRWTDAVAHLSKCACDLCFGQAFAWDNLLFLALYKIIKISR